MVATAQMVGGIVAAAILDGLTPGPLAVSVALNSGTNRTQGQSQPLLTVNPSSGFRDQLSEWYADNVKVSLLRCSPLHPSP